MEPGVPTLHRQKCKLILTGSWTFCVFGGFAANETLVIFKMFVNSKVIIKMI